MEYKTFKVGDLFTLKRSKAIKLKELPEGNTPVVTMKRSDQGVDLYCDIEPMYQNKLTVSMNGDCGATFYHDYPFAIANDSGIVLEKVDIPQNKEVYLYLATVLDTTLSPLFDWSNKLTASKFEDVEIQLPVTTSGEPDWQYMEDYMKDIMEEVEHVLDELNTDLASPEPLSANFGTFRLKDLYTAKGLKGYPIKEINVEDSKDDTGYYIYGQNIGIKYPYKVRLDEKYLHRLDANKPLLAYSVSVCEIGLIDNSFYCPDSHNSVRGLFPINYWPTINQSNYILTALKTKFNSLDYASSAKNIMDTEFQLPIDSQGNPDWAYMEQYMQQIMTDIKHIFDNLLL